MTTGAPVRERIAPVDYDPFAGATLARVVPTTEPQREVWLADRLGIEASLAYNESVSLRFSGVLDTNALREALQDIVQRHEALRASVSANGEELCIASDIALDIPETDHSMSDVLARNAAIATARQRVVETPFDINSGPLFRAEILKLDVADHLLLITAHHIVCDGWSFGVLVRDLAVLYSRRVGVAAEELDVAMSFGDYATTQSASVGGSQSAADEAYWLSRFSDSIPTLDLPVDHSRSAWRTFASRREDHVLDAELVSLLRKSGSRCGAGFFATLLGGFGVLLQRIAGVNDVVVGIPAAGQSVDGFDTLVGHCVNLLPLRLYTEPFATFDEVVTATQAAVLDAYEHQNYTLGTLLSKLAIERDPSRLPLVSVMFNIDQVLDVSTMGFPDLTVDFSSNPRSYENFELFINAVQVKGTLRLECQYNSDLFDGATIRRWLACYEILLRASCVSMQTAVGKFDIVSAEDRRLLDQWNDTSRPFPETVFVHELIEAQVARAPERIALTWRDTTLTYSALNLRANRIAHSLRALGVRSGALVGIHVGRSADMVAVMLAVMKAGGAYVPLDPSYPIDRLAFMAEDAGLLVLVSENTAAKPLVWPRERGLLLDADAQRIGMQSDAPLGRDETASVSDDPAYVIYTSGSTGKPKGVRVPHRAVVNFLYSMAREPGLTESDRIVAVTTLSFDIAVNELLLPLTVGATIVVAEQKDTADGTMLCELLEASGATTMQATPATWRLLIDAGWNGNSRFKAMCGGEALSADLAQQLLERAGSLWNLYGPTETTVWSTCLRITDGKAGISVGRPIGNTTIWILDEQMQLCPVGVPGEIWIGGDGVVLGYLNRPELTAERFVSDPYSRRPGARIYRTGDRGRWRADGLLEHLGRLDFQVKVRGYRIELGEVEAALAMHPGVERAVVIAREDRPGDVRLVAYLVAVPAAAISVDMLRAHLKATLPEYMIPQHFLILPRIPLLPNGKLDRKSLPVPDPLARPQNEYIAPRSDLEKVVALEMEAVLGMPGVGVHDDFFALGGHSLLAAHLTHRLNRCFASSLSMRTIFESPTVARLSAIIQAGSVDSDSMRQPIVQRLDQSRFPASLMQERLWLLEKMYPGRVVYHAPSAHRLQGELDESAFERAFREMVRRQPTLRTCFESEGNIVVQRVQDDVVFSLFPVEDLSKLPLHQREAKLLQCLDELTAETFDLSCAPLFRVRMFRLDEQEHVLFFMPHHIIWDGWSFDLFYEDMSALYHAFSENRANPLVDLQVSYGDFSVWHREWMKGSEYERQINFWRERVLRTGKPRLLPTDKKRGLVMSGGGGTEWIFIDKAKTDALHELSAQSGATLFATTLAVYAVLLYDYSRQSSMVIGTPVRGRSATEFESIMGYFNNLLPLHIDVEPSAQFLDLLKRVKATIIESFAYPDVPLEQIARELPAVRGEGAPILYQALFSFQDARQRITQWGGLQHSMIPLFHRGATEDLGMWFVESINGLQGGVTHNTDLLEPSTAQWLRARYLELLTSIVANPSATVIELTGEPDQSVIDRIERTNALAGDGLDFDPAAGRSSRKVSYAAPRSDFEVKLVAVWQRVLGLEHVGIDDNFFELGGNSLSALNLITEMEAAISTKIDLSEIVRSPTIASLVSALGSAQEAHPGGLVELKRGGSRNLFLVHDGDGATLLYLNLARCAPDDVSVFGIEPSTFPGVPLASTSIESMAALYIEHVRRKQPKGPYLLGGMCAGGVVAYAMATQLVQAGERVDLVAIIDGGTPQAEVKAGLRARQRGERLAKALADARATDGSPIVRAWSMFSTIVRKACGGFAWEVSSRLNRLQTRLRFYLLCMLLTRKKSWPKLIPALTFREIYLAAESRYVPERLANAGVVLIRSTTNIASAAPNPEFEIDDTPYIELYADETFGWGGITDKLIIADVDGGHSSMLWEPYVKSVAAVLMPSLSNNQGSTLGACTD